MTSRESCWGQKRWWWAHVRGGRDKVGFDLILREDYRLVITFYHPFTLVTLQFVWSMPKDP